MHLFHQPNNHKPFHQEQQNKGVLFQQNLKSMKKQVDVWISGLYKHKIINSNEIIYSIISFIFINNVYKFTWHLSYEDSLYQ